MMKDVKIETHKEITTTRNFTLNTKDLVDLLKTRASQNVIGEIDSKDEFKVWLEIAYGESIDLDDHPIHVVITSRDIETE
jgi:hypothetical protein